MGKEDTHFILYPKQTQDRLDLSIIKIKKIQLNIYLILEWERSKSAYKRGKNLQKEIKQLNKLNN